MSMREKTDRLGVLFAGMRLADLVTRGVLDKIALGELYYGW